MRALGVRRTVAAVVGLLFMTLGSLILSGYGGWPITVGGEEIFPFPKPQDRRDERCDTRRGKNAARDGE